MQSTKSYRQQSIIYSKPYIEGSDAFCLRYNPITKLRISSAALREKPTSEAFSVALSQPRSLISPPHHKLRWLQMATLNAPPMFFRIKPPKKANTLNLADPFCQSADNMGACFHILPDGERLRLWFCVFRFCGHRDLLFRNGFVYSGNQGSHVRRDRKPF